MAGNLCLHVKPREPMALIVDGKVVGTVFVNKVVSFNNIQLGFKFNQSVNIVREKLLAPDQKQQLEGDMPELEISKKH